MTLRNKLFMVNILLIVFILAVFILFSIKVSDKSIEKNYEIVLNTISTSLDKKLESSLKISKNILENKFAELELEAKIIAEHPDVKDLILYSKISEENIKENYVRKTELTKKSDISYYANNLAGKIKGNYFSGDRRNIGKVEIELVDKSGNIIGKTDFENKFTDVDDSKKIRESIKNRATFSDLVSSANGVAIKTYKSITSDYSMEVGVIILTMPLDADFINELRITTGIDVFLFNKFKIIGLDYLYHENKDNIFENFQSFDETTEEIMIKDISFGKNDYRAAYTKIKNTADRSIGGIVMLLPKNELNAAVKVFQSKKESNRIETIREIILISFMVFIIIAVFIYFVTMKISWRITKIAQVVSKIAKGDLTQEININSKDELEKLSKNINLMAKQLKENFTIEKEWNKNLEIMVAERTKEVRELLEDMEKKNKQLVALDKMKDEFLANTSHELRTPLNGIIGIGESLIDGSAGDISEKLRKNISMIVYSGRRLASLVNDILDFSKMKEKTVDLGFEKIDIKDVADIVVELTKPLLNGTEVKITNNLKKIDVYADESRLEQIFHNLLGNAVKFTEKGIIEIDSKIENDMILISVKDTGIGIAKDKHESIFMTFEQGDGSISRKYGGTGIGLSITKQLVELHGGKIWVESEEGKGSIFYFTIPLYKNQKIIEKKQDKLEKSRAIIDKHEIEDYTIETVEKAKIRGKILIVDDEIINLNVLNNYLGIKEYEIDTALNGEEVIRKIFDEHKKYDLIILDVMMPKMSGYEVCERIRKTFSIYDLPVLMLTAKNRQEDIEEGFRAGANDYLTKPIYKKEMYARVETLLSMKNGVENAILNAKKAEKERQERVFSEKMRDLTKTLSSTLIVKEVLNKLIEKISDILEFDKAIVLLNENGHFNIVSLIGIKMDMRFDIFSNNYELYEEIQKTKSTVYVEKINLKSNEMENCIAVPLVYRSNIIGALIMQIKGEYSDIKEKTDIVQSFSGQAGFAIENAKLFEEVEEKRKELADMFEKVKTLENLVSVIYTEKDKKRAVDFVLMLIISKYGLNYRKGMYLEYIPEIKELIGKNYYYNFSEESVLEDKLQEVQDMVSFEEANIRNVKIKIKDKDKISESFLTKKIIYGNIKKDTVFIKDYHFENYIILPIYYRENVYGLVLIESEKNINEKSFEAAKDILTIFTSNLAIYFENVKLEEDALKTAKFKTMIDLSKAIVHEIRSPLATIDGFSKMTKSKVAELDLRDFGNDEKKIKNKIKMENYLETITKEVKRVDEMANDLLEYSSIESLELIKYDFELDTLIEDVLNDRKKDIEDNGIEIFKTFEKNLTISADYSKLRKTIFHIIKNAIEAFDMDKEISYIEIKTYKEKENAVIFIKDNGIGIAKEKMAFIYEPMVTTKIQGTGLGLTIVKGIIEKHNGKIEINSIEKDNTIIKISIPILI